MKTQNTITLTGPVVSTPKVAEYEFSKRKSVRASFDMNTGESIDSGEGKRVYKHRVVAWDVVAEYVRKFVEKDQWVDVTGSVQYRTWKDDKNGGITKYITEIVATEIKAHGQIGQEAADAVSTDLPF